MECYLHIASWDVEFACLDMSVASSLEFPFTKFEIFEALREFDGDKAPGPDGLSFNFVKSYWHILKADMLVIFQAFRSFGVIGDSHNLLSLSFIRSRILLLSTIFIRFLC